jgi:hypothetical protein
MQYFDVELKDLGGGVFLFENTLDLDWDWVFNFAKQNIEKELTNMYTKTIHPDTGVPCYVNRSGYFFDEAAISKMPARALEIHRAPNVEVIKFLSFIEEVKYRCLIKYMEKIPHLYKCIWWKSKGHISGYFPGGYLGPHSDISSDFNFGFEEPKFQFAMKNVVGSIVYFNDSIQNPEDYNGSNFVGGEHNFTYLNIEYSPKKGDILMFPSDYMATHEVKVTTLGERYAYLGWYGQGSANEALGEKIWDPLKFPDKAVSEANLYLPFLTKDFQTYLLSKGYEKNEMPYSLTNGVEQSY